MWGAGRPAPKRARAPMREIRDFSSVSDFLPVARDAEIRGQGLDAGVEGGAGVEPSRAEALPLPGLFCAGACAGRDEGGEEGETRRAARRRLQLCVLLQGPLQLGSLRAAAERLSRRSAERRVGCGRRFLKQCGPRWVWGVSVGVARCVRVPFAASGEFVVVCCVCARRGRCVRCRFRFRPFGRVRGVVDSTLRVF